MVKDIQSNSLVIHQKSIASAHRLVYLLSEDCGLITATSFNTLYSKGRRAVLTTPYCQVKCFLSHNRQQYILTDVEEITIYSQINLNINCYYQAALYSEACLVSHAAGGDKRLYPLYCYLFLTLNPTSCYQSSYCFLLLFLYYNGSLPKLPFSSDELILLDSLSLKDIFEHQWPQGWFTILLQNFTKLFTRPLKSLSLAASAWP